ncbi:hypothetical protein [Sphingomonas bacterium]|uniref:hypothetical protein n=1 Tax=Sphingomonas bacterium TaxID=1895847 RepID=UPI0026138436|nr:hypothetical protein [Sphingomonas bacterium]MDB5678917.1 hypothetical protein [Sphingomonas bacterium]
MSDGQISSEMIEGIANLAIGAGNVVKAISSEWKPKQVVFMDQPISPALNAEIIAKFPSAEAFDTEATPHNPATEGVVNRSADVVIAFPTACEQRRWY